MQGMGYQVRTHHLSHFHDDYGLKTGDEDEGEDEEVEEDADLVESSEGSEESSDDD